MLSHGGHGHLIVFSERHALWRLPYEIYVSPVAVSRLGSESAEQGNQFGVLDDAWYRSLVRENVMLNFMKCGFRDPVKTELKS